MKNKNPKPSGYWKNKQNIIVAVREIMQEHNLKIPPTSTQLRKWDRADVDNAISTYLGGYEKLRIEFGESVDVKYGEGTDTEKLRQRSFDYMQRKDYSTLPPRKVMLADGEGGLEASIGKLSGGISRFRKFLGVVPVRVERGSWENVEFRIGQVIDIMNKHGLDELPSTRKLEDLGYKSLVRAIYTYDKSFPNFRKLFEEREDEINRKKWTLDYTLEKAYEFMKEHPEYNQFPEPIELVWNQKLDLLRATTVYRNLIQFREMLVNYIEKKDGYDLRSYRDYSDFHLGNEQLNNHLD